MTLTLDVRLLEFDELERVLALNQTEVPNVGDLDRDRLLALLADADVALGVERDGGLAGFVVAMGPTSSYLSPNYRWFAQRHEDFLYIDRVVVAEGARGEGLGRALYDAAFEARPAPIVAAEVNVEPPNPGSLAFHERLGFHEVARVEHRPGYVVAMVVQERDVPDDQQDTPT